jgi:hypothetical protein
VRIGEPRSRCAPAWQDHAQGEAARRSDRPTPAALAAEAHEMREVANAFADLERSVRALEITDQLAMAAASAAETSGG